MDYLVPRSSMPPPPANTSFAGHGAQGGAKPNFGDRQKANELAIKCLAYSMVIIIALFILSHWVRHFTNKLRISWSPFVTVTRLVRRVVIRKVPGFQSAGHAVLVLVYAAINLALAFTGYDWDKPTNFASRFGWMAAGNLALVVFLAMKNTPLAILTSYSYERLNPLHQIAGYMTAVYMILHGSVYSWYFISNGKIAVMRMEIGTAGIVLGFAMFATVVEAVILRRLQYEMFYVIHVALFIVAVVTLGLHRPELDTEKVGIVACFVAGMWGLDRLIRFTRLMYNSVNNQATVHPLPNGGTRILLSKPLHRAIPGRHCYVWLPKIRMFESHPFTIAGTEPTELIVNSYSGFTRDLHKYAVQNPGASLKVSLEGPYGTFPDPMHFDKVIMIAGGSGASFTFGLAANMLSRMTESSTNQIEFIWTVKTRDNLVWFADHLKAIRDHVHAPKVALKLHATRPVREHHHHLSLPGMHHLNRSESETSETSGETSQAAAGLHNEKVSEHNLSSSNSLSNTVCTFDDPEKGPKAFSSNMSEPVDVPVQHGRPDVATLIREYVASVDKDKKVLITACGPQALMKLVRNTAASCITTDGPSVEFHGEEFGW